MTAADPASDLLAALARRGLTVATAESLTGGLLAAAITAIPGASASMRGGVVSYATDVKAEVLGVPQEVLGAAGPVSSDTARCMAAGVRSLLRADLGLATTGVAGPGPLDGIPPGLVFVAAVLEGGPAIVQRFVLVGDRAVIRATCVDKALHAGLEVLAVGQNGWE